MDRLICAFQWDLARQAERLPWLLRQLPRYAEWGYRELYLHLEDAVEYPSVPGVARAGAYRYGELERLVKAAGRAGIGVVPIVNLLGHTQYLIKVPALRELNERRTAEGRPMEMGQVCPAHPGTWELAERLLGDMAPFCTAGKVHVGLDESYHLGRHPLSQAEIEDVGLAGHFGRYVQRLHGLCSARGLKMGLWADMLALLPEAIAWVPPGAIAYDWYYYPFRRRPAVELYNFREYDLAGRLRARGVKYWGCPMSGPFRHEPLPTFGDRLQNIRSWWRRCQAVEAEGMLVTQWETSRVSAPVVQAVDAAAAGLWLEGGKGVGSDRTMLAAGFARAFGARRAAADRIARAALAADRYPFAGYYRWELNDDWEAGARGDAREQAKEADYFKRLERRARGLPGPFAASIRWRNYLAKRDALVVGLGSASKAGRGQFAGKAQALRREMVDARVAAQAMWKVSRSGSSPQALALRQDARRLSALLCAAPGVYLRFSVDNFRPAMQQVVVEVPVSGSGVHAASAADEAAGRRFHVGELVHEPSRCGWKLLRGRHTMEFTRIGARRFEPNLKRPFAVALPEPLPAQVRIAVRGVGEVRVGGFELIADGRVIRFGPRRLSRIGSPAPSRGFPALDWTRNEGAVCLLAIPAPQKR